MTRISGRAAWLASADEGLPWMRSPIRLGDGDEIESGASARITASIPARRYSKSAMPLAKIDIQKLKDAGIILQAP